MPSRACKSLAEHSGIHAGTMQPMTCVVRRVKAHLKGLQAKRDVLGTAGEQLLGTAGEQLLKQGSCRTCKALLLFRKLEAQQCKVLLGAVHLLEQGQALPEAVHLLARHLQVEAVQAGAAQQLVQHPEGRAGTDKA